MTQAPPTRDLPSAVVFAVGSFAVSMLVFAIKMGAWWATGSVVLLADMAESSLDMVTALLLVLAVRLSAKPPDEGHPWGHGKVEYFSSGFQGALILAAGVGVAFEAVRAAVAGSEVIELGMGLGLSALATAINLLLALALIRAGRRMRSPALEADGRHNATDVVTTLGGWTGLGLAWATGWWVLDPIIALLVAAQILWTGVKLIRDATQGLMDAAIPEEQKAALTLAFDTLLQGIPGAHYDAVRARQSSKRIFVDCVLRLPGGTSVQDAHALCDQMEMAAAEAVPGAEVHIHVEPTAEQCHRR